MQFLPLVLVAWGAVVRAALVSRGSGGLRGTSGSAQLAAEDGRRGVASVPPSCEVLEQMLGRVYYIRDQLDTTTASLASLGYKTGEEWNMDQGIGSVTPDTMADIVCALLANVSKPDAPVSAPPQATVTPQATAAPQATDAPQATVAPQATAAPQASLLTHHSSRPHRFTKLQMRNLQAQRQPQAPMPTVSPEESQLHAELLDETTPAPSETTTVESSIGGAVWGWLSGGGGETPKPTSKPVTTEPAPVTQQPNASEGAAPTQPPVTEGTEGTPTTPSDSAEGGPTTPPGLPAGLPPGPTTPMVAGCPSGSPQASLLAKLNATFDGLKKDKEALKTVRHIFEDLLLSIENGVLALYSFRGCPKVAENELKTRHVCEVNRAKQAKALMMHQNGIPEMRSKLFKLQSRVREIDSGKPKECFFASKKKTKRGLQAETQDHGWCMELQAVIDALLDGRAPQKQWLKDMGDGIKHLSTMAMQLNRNVQDPTLRKDKIPLNALKAMTNSWKGLMSPLEQLRMMGSIRASQAQNLDGIVLQLTGLLRNVSSEERCISEGFQQRYGAQDCASLRLQLNAAVQARQTDLEALQQSAATMMLTASNELVNNSCGPPKLTPGCWLRMPTGCPNLPNWRLTNKWMRDVFGEESTGAAVDQGICTVSRKLQLDNLCGTFSTEMRFIPQPRVPDKQASVPQ